MSRMRKFRDGITAFCCVGGIALLAGGCPPPPTAPPTFTPGAGGSDVGTVNDGQGTNFRVTELADGGAKVVADGGGEFSSDNQGRATNLTTSDESKIDVQYQADGSADVQANVKVFDQDYDVAFEVPPGGLPSGKQIAGKQILDPRAQEINDICDVIDLFCANLDLLVQGLLPEIRAEIFARAQIDPNSVPGIALGRAIDNVTNKFVDEARRFCAAWQQLAASGVDPCSP